MEIKFIREFLEEKYYLYNRPEFIETDPVHIPHNYTNKNDIEISAFLVATISWGQRSTIIRNGLELMHLMKDSPYDFIINFGKNDLEMFDNFRHRTFQPEDCKFFLLSLQNIYKNHDGLQNLFEDPVIKGGSVKDSLINFRKVFFEIPHPVRTRKHISSVEKGASAKRLNMFLRWMVRPDRSGIDFGIWKGILPKDLFLPLDVHTGNVSRKLGILTRKQNDWKSVEEVTSSLRKIDPADPVKYDYALFGLGIYEKF
ncbi:MAG: TIGR02757 family protein [Bacteroidetes bacterium]|nr:TIGR02757 family protein [Bacteroidota bacterium]